MKTRISALCALFLVAATTLGLVAFTKNTNPNQTGNWNPDLENTTSGTLSHIDMDSEVFTLDFTSWCAAVDGNDVNGTVTFTMKNPDDLVRMRQEIPLGTRIVVVHERAKGVVSDSGELIADDFYAAEPLFVYPNRKDMVITTGTLASFDTAEGTIALDKADWSARADGNSTDGTVVFRLKGPEKIEEIIDTMPVGTCVAVTHNRAEGILSDAGQIACFNVRTLNELCEEHKGRSSE
ncbi:MAG: hypothetical protein Q4B77_06925 [Coriobacteriaceae bacterium]|nr:hypothetical protein [Coriobacteriaceae bacterium]